MKTLSLVKSCLAAGFILELALGFATAQANCFDCHETTACLSPTKPAGTTCGDCHLGPDDINDYTTNFTTAIIDTTEWQAVGHGSTVINDNCEYCHDYSVGHNDPTNPFRLTSTSTADADGQNSNCLTCHATDAAGFDPDDGGTGLVLVNSAVKIDSNHAGARHDTFADGGYFCWDCHDPHGDSNIAMIHDEVTQESDGQYGVPITTVATSFTDNLTGTDYARSIPPFNGICQVCHTSANHYGSSYGDDHNDTSNCILCHEHNEGFKPNCNACHGYPPVVDTPQLFDGLVVIPDVTGSTTAGAHQIHVGDYGYSCYTCHFDGMPDTPVVDDYKIQMGFDIMGFTGGGSTYNEQTLNPAYSYVSTNGTTIGLGTPTTCENMYCHSDGTAVSTSFSDPATFPGPHQNSPVWDGYTDCSSCHAYGPAYPPDAPKANIHVRHLDLFNNPLINYDENPCHFCHYDTTNDGATISDRTKHVNRQYDVAPNTGAIYYQNLETPIPVNFSYTYDAGGGSCFNISCHLNIMAEDATWGTPIDASYSWSYGIGCGSINFSITVTSSFATPPYTYYIDWESDGIWDYTGPDSSHSYIYPDASTQYITYSVRDADGRTLADDGTAQTGPIANSSNALPIVAVTSSVSELTVTLTDQSYDPDYNTCGHTGSGQAIIDWGPDGYEYFTFNPPLSDSPSGQKFSHTYISPGTYTIRYGVYDNVITYPEFLPNFQVTVP